MFCSLVGVQGAQTQPKGNVVDVPIPEEFVFDEEEQTKGK